MLQHDVASFTIEIGGAYVVNEEHVQTGKYALWKTLSGLGMVEPNMSKMPKSDIPQSYLQKVLKYSHEPRADASGIIRFIVSPGDIVKMGQPVALIYNVFGKLQSTLAANKDGIVLGHADSSVAFPGAEVVAFGV